MSLLPQYSRVLISVADRDYVEHLEGGARKKFLHEDSLVQPSCVVAKLQGLFDAFSSIDLFYNEWFV